MSGVALRNHLGIMKKLYAAILIFAFATCYIPVVKTLLQHDTTTCFLSLEEEKQPESKKYTPEKKEVKDLLVMLSAMLQQANIQFSYIHNSQFWGNNLAADVITPPPNQS
jgi:hypothetical protein